MTPSKKLEDSVRSARVTTSAATDERISAAVEAAKAKRNEQSVAGIYAGGGRRRIIMRSNWTKLATAAAIIVVIGLGIYTLTGSIHVTSITTAQVRQAMENIDWMQIINEGDTIGDGVAETDWFSFTSKVEIKIDRKGRISYADFAAQRELFWPGEDKDIFESSLDTREFAQGTGGPFEMIERGLRAGFGDKVVKKSGNYQGRKVEIWTANLDKNGSAQKLILYMDIDTRLPVAATFTRQGTIGVNPENNYIEFKYPETGPADIYEAGAPRSAQIKPAPEQ